MVIDKGTLLQLLAVILVGALILIVAICATVFSPAIVVEVIECSSKKLKRKRVKQS